MRPLAVRASLFAVLLAACAHKQDMATDELSAQTGEDLGSGSAAPEREPSPQPAMTTTRIGAPAPDGGAEDWGPEEPGPQGAASPGYVVAVCPLECYVADGRNREPITGPRLDALRAAFTPIMSGLRQCVASSNMENERHKPTINLRFGPRGELLDVGADPTGWDESANDCMLQVVRGGAAYPSVTFDGPAAVRCSERCDAHPRWTTAPR